MKKSPLVRWGALALATVATLACSKAEEAPQPSGASMSAAPATAAPGGANRAPVIERVAFEPDEPIPGGRVRAVVRASDPDGGSLRLRYAWTLAGTPTGGDQPELTLEQGNRGQELELVVIASDGAMESAPMRSRTTLGNRGPNLFAVELVPRDGLAVGAHVKAVPDARDPDDDVLRYEATWRVNGKAIPETGLELDTKGLHKGDRIQVELRASDGKATTAAVASSEVSIGNSGPKIVSRPETRFDDGLFRYDVEAKDPDGERNLRFSLASAPDGMSIDRLGGEIRWMPKPEQAGKHTIEVVVEDAQGAKDIQTFELNIGKEPGTPAATQLPAAPAPE